MLSRGVVALPVALAVGVAGLVSPGRAETADPSPAPSSDAAVAAAWPGAATSSDVALSGFGDGDGYHLQVARESSGFGWTDVAVLDPGGLDEPSWFGYECLSGDGQFAAVTVLPGSLVNVPQALHRGAYAFAVDLTTGAVTPVLSGVSFQYSSPGCGVEHSATFTASLDDQQSVTGVDVVDLSTGEVTSESVVAGQVTSAVPTAGGVVGAVGAGLVQVVAGGSAAAPAPATVVAPTGGQAYEVRPAADGGVDFLVATPSSTKVAVKHWTGKGAPVSTWGSGELGTLGVAQGRGGHNAVLGLADGSKLPKGGLRRVTAKSVDGRAGAVSLDGDAAFTAAPSTKGDTPTDQPLTKAVATGSGRSVTVPVRGGALQPPQTAVSTRSVPGVVLTEPLRRHEQFGASDQATGATRSRADAHGVSLRGPVASGVAPASFVVGAAARTAGAAATPASGSTSASVLAATTQTPKCGVPRLDPALQALQPSPAQVDWAVQMAEQGLLKGMAYTRPAGFANLGLAAYAPSTDFTRIALHHPASDTWDSVPRSVYEAVVAQESNFSQASWHALPGIAGAPLIADYYGAAGTLSTINYAAADCGYGLGQVTTGMAASETSITANGKKKVAVDYQENVAAGLQILSNAWNRLYDSGVTVNGGNPRYLENWYLAIWAYNSGIQPTAALGNTTGCTPSPTCTGPDGTWGLGWSNNPVNPSYPPDRAPYLKTTYADASHPASWPYQERVMGWMASPIIRLSKPAYDKPTYRGGSTWIQIPPRDTFCSSANLCDPTYVDPANPAHTVCTLTSYQCWWHEPVTFVASCSTTCATSSYQFTTGSTEPTYSSPHPPTCNVNPAKLPTTSSGAPIIVDDLAVPANNRQGCTGMNWSNNGTFTMTYGTNAAGDPLGQIDMHQLGAGFGGHVYFTHTQQASSASLVDTGRWTPNLPSLQYYKVKIHLPATGATATNVVYNIYPGGGVTPWKIRVNQDWGSEEWVTIGTFAMTNGGYVTLSNESDAVARGVRSYSSYDVAFDAVAFLPQGGTPGAPIGGPPTVQDAPKGSNPAWVNCGCVQRTAGDPVSTATGYFGDTFTDLVTAGDGALRVTRSYASALADPAGPAPASAVDGPFGYGWTFTYGLSAATAPTTGAVTITQEDGSQVAFTKNADGTYATAAPRFDATLTLSGGAYTYVRGGTAVWTFDAATGHLTSINTLAGTRATPSRATTLTYDTAGHLRTVTDAAGRAYTFTWTGNHIASVTDGGARRVDYGYDTAGNLTDVYGVGTLRPNGTRGDEDHATFGYDARHLMTWMRSAGNYGKTTTPAPMTSMTYDSADRVTVQTDPAGAATTFTYGPAAGLQVGQTLVTDPVGSQRLDTYSAGLLTSQTIAYGTSLAATTSYTYDPITLGVTSVADPDGNVVTYSYDDHGNAIQSSDALGFVTASTYDDRGHLLARVGPDGTRTTFGYDEAGHITTSGGQNDGTTSYGNLTSTRTENVVADAEVPDGNPPTATSRTTAYYYDDPAHPGSATRVVDARGKTTTTSYTATGQTAAVTDPDGRTAKYGYDATTGAATVAVTPRGVDGGTTTGCSPPAVGCTTTTYDVYGNVTATTDPAGRSSALTWDVDGHQLTGTDPLGNTTSFGYDAVGRPTTTTRADHTVITTAYAADGTTASTTDAAGKTTTYTYDAAKRVTEVSDPAARATTSTYSRGGRLTTVTDPAGATTTLGYDADGRIVSRTHSDGATPNVAIAYDSSGNRVSATDGTGTSTWVYDTFGQVIRHTDGAGNAVSYGYDANGNQTSEVYPGGRTVARTFDDAGQLTRVKDWNNQSSTFTYNLDGALTSTTYPNGTVATTAVDATDRPTSDTLTKGTSTIASLTYGRNNAGQVTGQNITGIPGGNRTYTYSPLNQLASAIGARTDAFAYDAAGNPTTVAGSTQAFDSVNQLCWTVTATPGPGADCTHPPAGATAYSFDAAGDRTKLTDGTRTTTYGYDKDNHLTAAHGAGLEAAYTYDLDGLRSTKTVNGTVTPFTWDSAGLLLTDGATAYVYGPGGIPLEEVAGTTTRWYFHDQLGSTRALTDATGAVVGSYDYDAYGQPTHAGTAASPLTYTGQYLDAETGFYYLRARYYDPTTALFLTVDPLLRLTGQRYAYGAGDPLDASDPTGMWSWRDTLFVAVGVGVVAGVILCVATVVCGAAAGAVGGGLALAEGGAVLAAGGAASVSIGAVATSASIGASAATVGTMGAYWLSESAGSSSGSAGKTSSSYKDVTSKGSRVRNIETDTTIDEFKANLEEAGWDSRMSQDGKTQIFTKDGCKYAVRQEAKSWSGGTAEYTPQGASKFTTKIRLGGAP
jgi:RHS repeat-associated protein